MVVAVLLPATSAPLPGQRTGAGAGAAPVAGDRIRVTAPALGLHRATGQLDEIRADTLFVRGLGPIPGGSLTRLDVSAGRRSAGSAAVRGAGYGAAVGGGLGLIALGIGIAYDGRDRCSDCMISGTMAGAAAVVVGVAGGTVAGGMVGLIVRPERWNRLPLPLPSAMRASPPRRLQLGLSLPLP